MCNKNTIIKTRKIFAIFLLSLFIIVPVMCFSMTKANAAVNWKDYYDSKTGKFVSSSMEGIKSHDEALTIANAILADKKGGTSKAVEFGETYWAVAGQHWQFNLFSQKVYISGVSMADDASEYLTLRTDGNNILAEVWGVVKTIAEGLKPIGSTLVAIFFVMELIDCVSRGQFTPEILFKGLIKLFISVLLVSNIADVTSSLVNLGAGFTDLVSVSYSSGTNAEFSEIWNYVKENDGPFDGLIEYVGNFIPWIAMYIAKIVISVLAISRAFEIAIRAAFAPIGVADIYEGGTKSSGFRYLKKLLAVATAGAVMLLILHLYSKYLTGDSNFLYKICITFATITILGKATSFASDMFGV